MMMAAAVVQGYASDDDIRAVATTFGGVEHCPDTGACLLREGFRFPCGEEFFRGNERAAFHVEVPRFVPAVTGKAINEFGL